MNSGSLPTTVEELHRAFRRIEGVALVDSGIESIGGVTVDQLGNFEHWTLPHGALRRTGGALGDEALIWIELELERTDLGWQALEFLAWWVRAQARGGTAIQLTPFGLPPVAAGHVQLGTSLRFCIHLFRAKGGDSVEPHLAVLSELAADLVQTSDLYNSMLLQAGGQDLLRPMKYGA